MTVPIFVINLARDAERRRLMAGALDALGLAAEFVPAVEGRALSAADRAAYDPARALRHCGAEMLPNELGCYLSHYRLYQRIVAEGLPAAVVMEDDLRLEPSLPAVLDDLLALPAQDWLMVRLTALRTNVLAPRRAREVGVKVADLPHGGALYRLRTHTLGSGAYLIKQAAAARLLDYGRRIYLPLDNMLDRYWENGIAPHVVRPFPAHHRAELESRIGARPPERRKSQPLSVRLRRRLQRIEDSLRKRAYNLGH